jgi:hypothetical protein
MADLALYSLNEDNEVIFSFKNTDRLVSGPGEALQIVAYAMFTDPGSNAFARDEGGGLLRIKDNGVRSETELRADAAVSVSRAMSTIRKNQSRDKPANATVTGLKLLGVQVRGQEIRVEIRIDLLDGNSFRARFRT